MTVAAPRHPAGPARQAGAFGPALRTSRGRLRPLAEDDLDAVAALHRRTFGPSEMPPAELLSYLGELFFRHPWPDARIPSLVYEEGPGELVGCLGVMPRPMVLDGEPILAAVSHNFMVDPERRSSMAAVELMKALFAGPQDLSLAEGNDSSRRLWTALGGSTSLAYSIRWTHPLRPARQALQVLERRDHLGRLAAAGLRPLAALADSVAARLPGSPLRPRDPGAPVGELDAASLARGIERLSRGRTLRPSYDAGTLAWLLRALTLRSDRGELRTGLVGAEGDGKADAGASGWYLYYARPGDVGEVVQVGASEESAGPVLDHLLRDARRHGVLAVSGLLDPPLVGALSERACLFHRGRSATWLLVHGRGAGGDRAARALHTGDAFFTHLEGEWWL